MCLATPSKVIKIDGEWVEVESMDHTHRANISLLRNKGVNLGDYLLIHGDLAIQKLPEDEALKILEMIKTMPSHEHEDSHTHEHEHICNCE
ncbi:MAG: HypC/HybG/HupF family hydrogenase formation chaperone [Parcubacteria group bacterium]|nr:HypC/HybG/HupF family hydrogenase formation chaperone [Parcubacteria group bacterium]MCR4342940.1 HypC/HybG/HupF family hydrogenase formation chaperone [Patescibacteria group bacterium]